MTDFRDKIHIENALCVRQTDRAILVRIPTDDGEEEHWIPSSQVDDDSEVYGMDDGGTLVISEWFAIWRSIISKEGIS